MKLNLSQMRSHLVGDKSETYKNDYSSFVKTYKTVLRKRFNRKESLQAEMDCICDAMIVGIVLQSPEKAKECISIGLKTQFSRADYDDFFKKFNFNDETFIKNFNDTKNAIWEAIE